MYRLELIDDRGRTISFALNKEGAMTVGRHSENDIVLDGNSVSRNHCMLYVRHNLIEIEDLESTNGVFVRGQRIKGRTEINLNDEIIIGSNRFRLCELNIGETTSDTFMGLVSTEAIKKDE